ncbi:hypothetical protein BN2364_3280 [Alloalcanivorax xenomutans]|uniref:DUF2254 domain-containing protein n=1 Tax=Alloalcanivorax xenomutans TaxID=1094342 RepID=UPI0006D5C480|nr:DUF2254 domain-containing protein [Alloalcanivorax xenomutans]PHS71787.1 MAG: DUF2254 domain-containing protein [Alcanivorax sp.]CUR47721.1 hypothetical protein BN2364_3280 [Alloalcanivorax xenomutans]
MFSKWQWLLVQFSRALWVRATAFAILAVATSLLAIIGQRWLPPDIPVSIGAEAVDTILNVLASSMLAVTTFSLSVMVSAYSAATTNVTPRATRLLMQDTTTQNVLATFIGSFLFSLVGLVALSTGAYGEGGRVILFLVTLVVIVIIVVTILRWIEHLSRLGRVGETTDRVEQATCAAIIQRAANPALGGKPFSPDQPIPDQALPVYPTLVGYIQHVDVEALAQWAEQNDAEIYLTALPGGFVHPARPVAWLIGATDDDASSVREHFTVDDERSFDQDPRFGLVVLSEIASRALSPAVNDPGTAIDVIGRAVRVLHHWHTQRGEADDTVRWPRIRVPLLDEREFFDDLFNPIARDGAALLEVQIRLQKAFEVLASYGGSFRASARLHARLALARAEQALALERDRAELQELARWMEQD